ncbi:S41 family peptidase [Terriglobus roseus]|uniref:Carboxyl-terminal processing protease n=1 Tax=Terriglobus roseus TaxID=392734 RepID=A0A1G7M0V5_9BACT|nr:S41 family peptidase [Terriglobus roseus]SDF55377.1 carboxyl-terminal processing protease [Terriglobus roseus]
MPKSLKISMLALSAVLLLTMFLGANLRRVHASGQAQDGAYRQMQVYSEVLRHIQSDYVVDPNMPKVTDASMRGLLESLDAESSYLSPTEYKLYKEHAGKPQAGIGADVGKRYGIATVISVVAGGPADKAGLHSGDRIESIGDRSTMEMSLAEVQMALGGEKGTPVVLSMIRPMKNAPEKLTITRADTSLPATGEVFYESGSILYIKPGIIDKDHVQQVEQKLKAMGRTNSKKILLDLRDVSSGDDAEAIRMANLFLKSGTIAMLEGQKVAKQTFTAEPGKTVNEKAPMVTLVNRGTAGPAEIVAGALLDSKRSELVGEKTYGDGAQQRVFELADGGAIILSVAKFETPSGKKYQDEGLTPTTTVATAQELAMADGDEDDDNEAASTATVNSSKPAAAATTVAKPAANIDDQLNKALDILKAKAA